MTLISNVTRLLKSRYQCVFTDIVMIRQVKLCILDEKKTTLGSGNNKKILAYETTIF